jgi:hypothetical protein
VRRPTVGEHARRVGSHGVDEVEHDIVEHDLSGREAEVHDPQQKQRVWEVDQCNRDKDERHAPEPPWQRGSVDREVRPLVVSDRVGASATGLAHQDDEEG